MRAARLFSTGGGVKKAVESKAIFQIYRCKSARLLVCFADGACCTGSGEGAPTTQNYEVNLKEVSGG